MSEETQDKLGWYVAALGASCTILVMMLLKFGV